ncbi:MAG: hypothetical protein HY318_04650, partial [Armatimonadetes bacterium]|nr:hypothetical protein [Armatimonadota bacterium]
MIRMLHPVLLTALTVSVGFTDMKRQNLQPEEVRDWTRWLVPQPKQVDITGKLRVPVRSLRILLPSSPTELDQVAAQELVACLKETAEVQVPVGPGGGPRTRITITFARRDSDRKKLSQFRNSDQAYLLATRQASGGKVAGVTCAGITEVGVYYAVKTLIQLLRPTVKGKGPAATVDVPVVRIVDWPDLEERGEWGGSVVEDVEWMSDRKLNLIEKHADLTVDDTGIGHATMDVKLMDRARTHAVRIVPIIHHLEQLGDTGLFKAFPQLKAAGVPDSLCFSRPEVVTLLSQWLSDLGRIPGVFDVMIWMSEEGQGCKCERCVKNDRFVNEMHACVAAWERAKENCPKLGLRLLLTQASYSSNEKILAAVPEGVKVSYYDGGRTYDTSRRSMIYPLLEEYAKKGRWLGVYPTLGANWLIVGPFSNPEFVHYRMTEFVDKGLSCLVGYTVPANWIYPVNVEGAAEWSWNAHGRTTEEFTKAYAVRHGIKDPDKFALWTQTLGPASWDLYESRFPFLENYLRDIDKVAGGYVKRPLGTSIFESFKSEARFDEDLARCVAALTLANEIGDKSSVLETRIIQGYLRMLKSVWQLSEVLHGDEGVDPKDRETAKQRFDLYSAGSNAVTSLYPEWFDALAAQAKVETPQCFNDTIHLVDSMAARMGELMERLGFEDADKPYRLHLIGQWKTEDFGDQQGQVRRFDVMQFVKGAGIYLFQPKWRSGTLGLSASQVSLLSFAKDKPEDTREEAVDRHPCHAGAWVQGDVYALG